MASTTPTSQSHVKIDKNLSTKDRQKQINRMNPQGEKVEPKLAQEQRLREGQRPNSMIGNYAKGKGKKWLTAGIVGGNGLIIGGILESVFDFF